MSDSAKQNIVSLEDYGQATRGMGSDACAQALRVVCKQVENKLALYFSNMMGKVDDALFGRAEMAESSTLQAEYQQAMQTLRGVREKVEATFISHFKTQFNRGIPRQSQFIEGATPDTGAAVSAAVSTQLSNSEENRAIANMVHHSRDDCAQLLSALDKRIGFLIQDPDLEHWQNPLSPEAICAAFQATVRVIKVGLEIRLLMYKLFDQYVVSNMDELYKELNQQLVKMGVITDINSTLDRDNSVGADKLATMTAAPERTAASFAAPSAQQAAIDRQGSDQSSEMTIDIVAMLFDFILNDRNIPVALRALLGRLQIPLVKVAMLEREFFSRKSHPARQLLNTLATTAMGWDADQGHESASYRKIEAIVQTIADQFETDTSLFKTLLDDLQAFNDAEQQGAGIKAQCSVKTVQGQERLDAARSTTMQEIETRMGDEKDFEFVREFVTTHWKNLLVLTCARQGKNSDTWNQAVSTMDDLIWSVQAKNTDRQRQRLAAMQPKLIKDIRDGMQRLSLPMGETEDFIARLMDAHRQLSTGDEVAEQPMTNREQTLTRAQEPAGQTDDSHTDKVNQLSTGTWMEFHCSNGTVVQAKLSWISPINNTYLFTDKEGLKAGSYTLAELAELLRCGRANILGIPSSDQNA